MEEGRLAARLLSEIGAARAAIAASYLSLWRGDARPPDGARDGSSTAPEDGSAFPSEGGPREAGRP